MNTYEKKSKTKQKETKQETATEAEKYSKRIATNLIESLQDRQEHVPNGKE